MTLPAFESVDAATEYIGGLIKGAAGEAGPSTLSQITWPSTAPKLPTAANPEGITNPFYGTLNKGLLGLGVGAGLGGLTAAFSGDEDKRRNWLRHALKGALMGGALGGGAGALYHYGQAFMGGDAARQNEYARDQLREQIAAARQEGRVADHAALTQQLVALDTKMRQAGEQPGAPPLMDSGARLREIRDQAANHDWGGFLSNAFPRPAAGVLGGLLGGVGGYGGATIAENWRHRAAEAGRDALAAFEARPLQERIAALPDETFRHIFDDRADAVRRRMQHRLTASGNTDPHNMADAYHYAPPTVTPRREPRRPLPDLGGAGGSNRPTHATIDAAALVNPGGVRSHVSQEEFNALRNAANTHGRPDVPAVRTPLIGPRAIGGLAATAGALMPQWMEHPGETAASGGVGALAGAAVGGRQHASRGAGIGALIGAAAPMVRRWWQGAGKEN